MRQLFVSLMGLLMLSLGGGASAFCGFYVAKADARLFNRASQVVIVREGQRTVLTMSNDFKGEPSEFAIVIPVPTLLEEGQIHIGDQANIEHLDAYTAPRLVEYFDENPCERRVYQEAELRSAAPARDTPKSLDKAGGYGVTIEASYTVGEYDILILSAEQSDGLSRWLIDNDYKLPEGAESVLGSYIKQDMRFFVAKVNLQEQAKLGFNYLRPIQVAYESAKFMLPIRLGTVNADGPQELFIYTLTRKGRVETTNYPVKKLPGNVELPGYIKQEFADFYRDLFETQVKEDQMRGVFLEYAWDMSWCDPCAADPLSVKQLRELGVFWLDDTAPRNRARDAFVTRLHLRYDAEHFPEDLRFQETGDRGNFQLRYVLRHPWTGTDTCEAAEEYRRNLPERQERKAQTLANLTGWDINQIRERMELPASQVKTQTGEQSWWDKLWD